jgi:Ala-tRNA(Pro) deacylase
MAVLPASHRIDFPRLARAAGVEHAELCAEAEFGRLFPDCEVGAMPPFGNLYGLEVWADESLAGDERIAFNACSHRDLVQLAYRDWARLVEPRLASFALPE